MKNKTYLMCLQSINKYKYSDVKMLSLILSEKRGNKTDHPGNLDLKPLHYNSQITARLCLVLRKIRYLQFLPL